MWQERVTYRCVAMVSFAQALLHMDRIGQGMGSEEGSRLNSSCCADMASRRESLLEEPQTLRPKVKAGTLSHMPVGSPSNASLAEGDHRKGLCCDSSVNYAELGSPDRSR